MSTLMTVQDAAKVLGLKPLELFKLLRRLGYLTTANLPFNQHLSNGYFEIQHNRWIHPNDGLQYSGRTMITKKGLAHLDIRLREQKTERVCRRDSQAANDEATTRSIKQRA